MSNYIKHLILALKASRASQGLSQHTLADKVGIPQSHLSKIEQGGVNLKMASFLELARALGFEVMLVPRQHIAMVRAVVESKKTKAQDDVVKPAYELDNDTEGEGDD